MALKAAPSDSGVSAQIFDKRHLCKTIHLAVRNQKVALISKKHTSIKSSSDNCIPPKFLRRATQAAVMRYMNVR